MKFKSVDVETDIEGNATVKPVKEETSSQQEQEEQQEEEQQEQEDQEGSEPQEQEEQEEQQENGSESEGEEQQEQEEQEEEGLSQDSVRNFIKSKYGRDVENLEDLFKEKQPEVELSDDIKKYLEFKKNTGRNLEDFVLLNKDYSSIPESDLIRDFMKSKKPHLSSEEIEFEIENKFSFDEELDSDREIMAKKIAKKDFVQQAKSFFDEMKEKYATPLESREQGELSEESKKAIEFKQLYEENQKKQQKIANENREDFVKKTNELLNDKFEGFEFEISKDKSQVFKPADVKKLKESNLNIFKLLDKFTDDSGKIVDAKGYHKALSVASNPDEFAKFFYEQGKADMVSEIAKDGKNSNYKLREVHTNDDGKKPKYKALTTSEGKAKLRLKQY